MKKTVEKKKLKLHKSTDSYIKAEQNGMQSKFLMFSILILFTLALNKDWGSSSLVWWGSIGLFFVSFILSAKTLRYNVTYVIWEIAFVAFAFISVLWAENASLVNEKIKIMVVYGLILFLVHSNIRSMEDLEKVLKIWLTACVINTVYLVLTNSATIIDVGSVIEENYRFGDEGSWNSNGVGLMASGAALISLHFLKNTASAFMKVIHLCCMALMIFVSLITGSRKALLMMIMGICLYLFLTSKGKRVRIAVLIIGIIFGLYYMVMEVPYFYSIVGWRMEAFLSQWAGHGELDSSAAKRERYIQIAVDVWKSKPVLGYGLDCFRVLNKGISGEAMYAHNNYVELLADLGIVGFSIYYSGYLYLFKNVLQKIKESDLAKFLTVYLVIIAVLEYAYVSYDDFMTQFVIMLVFSFVTISKRKGKTDVKQAEEEE